MKRIQKIVGISLAALLVTSAGIVVTTQNRTAPETLPEPYVAQAYNNDEILARAIAEQVRAQLLQLGFDEVQVVPNN